MGDVYDDMPPLVARPPPALGSFFLPPIADDDGPPPLVERPTTQSRWEYADASPTAAPASPAPAASTPKPPNAFILFRASFVKANPVPRAAEADHATLSKIIALVWRGLAPAERARWDAAAAGARDAWRARNPDWRFCKVGNAAIKGSGGKKGGGEKGKGGEKGRRKKKGAPRERVEAIAGLLAQGLADGALADAVSAWDAAASPASAPVEEKEAKKKARRARVKAAAPYVRVLTFDAEPQEDAKPAPVDTPTVTITHAAEPYLDTQYDALPAFQFGDPAPVFGGAYAPAAIDLRTSVFDAAPEAYSPAADNSHADRRASFSSAYSSQGAPATPPFYASDPLYANASYGSFAGYYTESASPPGSPFLPPPGSPPPHSSYSTLSGWDRVPAAHIKPAHEFAKPAYDAYAKPAPAIAYAKPVHEAYAKPAYDAYAGDAYGYAQHPPAYGAHDGYGAHAWSEGGVWAGAPYAGAQYA